MRSDVKLRSAIRGGNCARHDVGGRRLGVLAIGGIGPEKDCARVCVIGMRTCVPRLANMRMRVAAPR